MSTLSVAKKDFLDVRRAKMVWFVCGMYALLFGLIFYAAQLGEPDIEEALALITVVGAFVIPLIALVTGYLAIAGERESGTIRYHLSLPTNRREIVLGKFLSRAAIVTAAILFAFVLAAVLGLLWYPTLEAAAFAKAAALTVVFTVTFVAIAVGISAMTASRSRAMGGSIAVYFLTVLLPLVPRVRVNDMLDFLLNDLLGLSIGENPLRFAQVLLSPMAAFSQTWSWVFTDAGPSSEAATWYLEPNVTIFVLLAWLVVPLVLGYVVFERSDLG